VGFFGDLFSPRTLSCEVCRAKAITISLLEEEIELLTRLLDEEREKLHPKVVERPPISVHDGGIRKSRVPWSRKQAQLEQNSAREAALEEKARWKARVEAVDAGTEKIPIG
jgi:hypothetical protein